LLSRRAKTLFALLRLFTGAGKASAPRLSFPAALTLFLPRQRPFLVAHLPELALQRQQAVAVKGIQVRVMRTFDHAVFLVAQQAALELA
jgi:hypothetical protein